MDLKLIIGVVIVVIILYLIWSYFFTSVKVLMSFQNASTMNCISGKEVSQSGLSNYSFSTWVYISDWSGNYNHPKNIITIRKKPIIGDSANLFRLYLDATRNDLHIYVKGLGYEENQSTCNVTNFPVQSWVNISVSVYNRAVDIYIDGKLVKTCQLANVAEAIDAGSTIYIGGGGGGTGCSGGSDLLGFTGYIASVLYNPDIISPQDAWNTYARGYSNSPLGMNNLFQRYKLEFAFLKDNNVIKSFKI